MRKKCERSFRPLRTYMGLLIYTTHNCLLYNNNNKSNNKKNNNNASPAVPRGQLSIATDSR